MINNGDGIIIQCPNCGEGIYLFDAEDVKLCPKCGGVILHSTRQD